MKHFINRSGGTGSWYTGRRVMDLAEPGDEIHFVFADTKMEDEDLYRFLRETKGKDKKYAKQRGVKPVFHYLADGRNPWQVFNDVRFLGNHRVDPCSKILKRDLIRDFLVTNFDPADTICYIGIDWSEDHRFKKAVPYWSPFEVRAPLTEPPYVDKEEMHRILVEDVGIALPRLYGLGFAHNNCGGFCIKGGFASFELLLVADPVLYAYHEAEEGALRQNLGKNVTILQDRSWKNIATRLGYRRDEIEKRGSHRYVIATGEQLPAKLPITMREFRERVQGGTIEVDPYDIGGCACFTPDSDEATTEAILLGIPSLPARDVDIRSIDL